MDSPVRARAEYKAVWDDLALTEDSAKMHVIGSLEEEHFEATARQTLDEIEATVGVESDDIVVEIGCGVGRAGAVIAPRCAEWIGCDVSGNMLRHAARRLRSLSNVRLVETSGFDLMFLSDSSVTLVYCTVVFMHLDEWDRYNYVREARRVLRPGGRLFVDNFNLCSDSGWDVFEAHLAFRPGDRPAHISKSSTPQELETYLKRAGFHSIGLRERPGWIEAYGVK